MTSLNFWKMQGAGNHFVVLDAFSDELPVDFDFANAAQVLCERGFGAGGDGLLLLERPTLAAQRDGATIRMRMWNPDGSEDMCGNGLRCIARLAHEGGHVSTTHFIAQSIAGLRACEVLSQHEIRVAMGQPLFARRNIPMQSSGDVNFARSTQAAVYAGSMLTGIVGGGDVAQNATNEAEAWLEAPAIEYELRVPGGWSGIFTSLSTGSTHTITFGEESGAPMPEGLFEKSSRLIENHEAFPERTSVLWAQVIERDRVRLRIWERGVGETLACGTGACAAAIAAQITRRCEPGERGIAVESRGGTLWVKWQPGREIYLSGPASIVYRGVWNE
ncbi:MAG: diaminopimelate epimerase [Abditibacteriota bacterium]|nr:diaminopimelate epimerase [Abditibacteriota bacterium]